MCNNGENKSIQARSKYRYKYLTMNSPASGIKEVSMDSSESKIQKVISVDGDNIKKFESQSGVEQGSHQGIPRFGSKNLYLPNSRGKTLVNISVPFSDRTLVHIPATVILGESRQSTRRWKTEKPKLFCEGSQQPLIENSHSSTSLVNKNFSIKHKPNFANMSNACSI